NLTSALASTRCWSCCAILPPGNLLRQADSKAGSSIGSLAGGSSATHRRHLAEKKRRIALPSSADQVTRREFVPAASALAALSALGYASRSSAALAGFPIGLQLYTVRDPLARDAFGTLKQVAALGYRDLETYGFDPDHVKYCGLDAKSFKHVLEDNGLTTSSGHYDL